ncbi:MAG: hypothetical protein M1840_005552 [Geoglossum simile]|nr:MAG: hypothetical protein M1840_005552 [Geoglossum simile]
MPRTRARTRVSAARPETLEVHAGRILWLMPKEGSGAAGVGDGCYDHPVVVLWTDELMKEAIVLIITSFDSHDLEDRHPTNPRVRALYLPIRPSPPHPDLGHLLVLHGDKALSKKSYVGTDQQHRVRWGMLKPYKKGDERDFKLSKKSLDVLMKYMKFVPPSPRVSQLLETPSGTSGVPHTRTHPAAVLPPPPRRTRTYPDIADLPRVSPSPASVPYDWNRGRRAQDSRMAGYLPYDERGPLIPQANPTPEGGSSSLLCGLLTLVVGGVLCVGVFAAFRSHFYPGQVVQEPVKEKWDNGFGAVPMAVRSVTAYLSW